MSGSQPLFQVEDVLGDNVLGDEETANVNEVLTDLGGGLDDLDEGVDDLASDVVSAADNADERVDDIAADVTEAANNAAGQADDILVDVINNAGDTDDTDADAQSGDDGDDTALNGESNDSSVSDGSDDGGATPRSAVALVLPANNSGVLGFAVATLYGNELDVKVVAAGLTPGEVHPLHIHGFADGSEERLPVVSDDRDGDGVGETPEGEAVFGTVLAGLTTTGEAQQGLETSPDYPTADAQGRLVFSETFVLEEDEADDASILSLLQDRIDGRVVELHGAQLPAGLGAGTANEVNGTEGYNERVPVAAGQLLELAGLSEALVPLLEEQPATVLNAITAFLDKLGAYALKPDGSLPDRVDADTPDVGNDTAGDNSGDGIEEFTALLLPTNNSGALGAATVTFDEAAGTIAVSLDLAGLEPGQVHASHIHGFTDDRASILPNLQVDADRDGFVEESEGLGYIGPVLLGLTEDGSISDAALTAAFPVADEGGRISLDQTYSFDLRDPAQAAIFAELADRIEGRAVQTHGLTLPATAGEGTTGEANGEAGYKVGLSIANGVLLNTDDLGGAFGAVMAELIQAGLDGEATDVEALLTELQPTAMDDTSLIA